MKEQDHPINFDIPDDIISKWQNIVNIIADIMGIPAALIMRLVGSDIEVFVSSHSQGNPYHQGDHESFFDSGLYCETAIKSNKKLLVPNALIDNKWKNNPDIKLNMISYLGFPILFPNGEPFGTICVLDNKENSYSKTYENLIINFRDIVQSHLECLFMNKELGEKNKKLSDYLSEIKILRGLVPICSFCKNVRNDKGYWQEVENYLSQHLKTEFTHGVCPECMKKNYPELKGDQ